MKIRQAVWQALEGGKRPFLDLMIVSLILLNVVALVAGSTRSVHERYGGFLDLFEIFSIAVFSLEYLARIWACIADPRYHRSVLGRLKFAVTPMALLDLAAVLPFFLAFVVDLRFLRTLRLLRAVRVAKLTRYFHSLKLFREVLVSRKEELVLTTSVMLLLLVMASCLIFEIEGEAQPNQFPDIPSAMWWSVATMTTVGYGDVYPITAAGKFFGSFVALLGIGFFALPAGILGSGFVDAIKGHKAALERCPHCGGLLGEEGSGVSRQGTKGAKDQE